MPFPVKPSEFAATILSATGALCDRLKAFLNLPSLVTQAVQWAVTEGGDPTTDLKAWLQPITVPPGAMVFWPSNNLPDGWIICNGSELDRTDFAALFSVLGTAFGSSSATTFKIPDMRGCVPAGANGSSFPFASTVGEEAHTLTATEIPLLTVAGGTNTTEIPVAGTFGSPPNAKVGPFTDLPLNPGGGQAHNNIQPSLCANWIIKT